MQLDRPPSNPMEPSPARAAALDQARDSFQRRAWREAYTRLLALDREAPLTPVDLEALGVAARLVGEDASAVESWTRASQGYATASDPDAAARCAFWVGYLLMFQGETAQAGGWLARAQRMLDDAGRDTVVRGYLLLPTAIQCIHGGRFDAALETFVRAAEYADRFHDPTLKTYGLLGQGRARIGRGELARGVALLDEAMVAVTADEVSPVGVGGVYCSLIEACHQIFDLRRADEWTTALAQWTASQPDLVPFRGECMVHRTRILQLRGDWPQALDEARRACDHLAQSPRHALGEAWYGLGEICRLRGEQAHAEDAYRKASGWRRPQPGLALLRLAQGQSEAALATIRREVDETRGEPNRCMVLGAAVEIALAAGETTLARAAAAELAGAAERLESPYLRAAAAYAMGTIQLREGDARAALAALRVACSLWRELDAPYEAARTEVHLALACRALGDDDAARLELDAARRTFERLGATPDLALLERLSEPAGPKPEGKLTAREVEVLRLVASGKTNRMIAEVLFISEKTVARHISNIFTKLDLPSRAAATAFAFRHGLV